MAKNTETKKVEAKKPVVKAEPKPELKAVVFAGPDSVDEPKPVNSNITCTHCSYTVARLNNEALVGVNCPKCKANGKLL